MKRFFFAIFLTPHSKKVLDLEACSKVISGTIINGTRKQQLRRVR